MIRPLTSLRFFAAMMVVAHHYWGFDAGFVGVGFFYVLSGYVLAYNYAGRVASHEQRLDFWWRRFARLYPTHLLTWLLALPLAPSIVVAIPSLLLLQSWIPVGGVYMTGNLPSWSISNEAFFYAVFPLLLGIRWRWLAVWLAALLSLALVWPEPQPFVSYGATVDPTHFVFYFFPPTRLFEFALGIALAQLKGRAGLPHEVAATGLAVVCAAMADESTLGYALVFVPASAALVHVFAHSMGPLARLLSHRWLVLLGDSSFMLYMLHWPMMRYMGGAWWVALLAVALSLALHQWFEKPAQTWLLGAFRKHASRGRHLYVNGLR